MTRKKNVANRIGIQARVTCNSNTYTNRSVYTNHLSYQERHTTRTTRVYMDIDTFIYVCYVALFHALLWSMAIPAYMYACAY